METTDARIISGMKKQLQARRQRLDAGARHLGWKVAINDPNAQRKLGIDCVAVGFLTSETRMASGAEFSLEGTTRPGAEPEVAITMTRDVAGTASVDEARSAIGEIAAAIEIVDINRPLENIEEVLSINIFHRAAVIGEVSRPPSDYGKLNLKLSRNDQVEAEIAPNKSISDLGALVQTVAGRLQEAGELLRAGDVIISGALVPPIWVKPGETVTADLGLLGSVSVRFTD